MKVGSKPCFNLAMSLCGILSVWSRTRHLLVVCEAREGLHQASAKSDIEATLRAKKGKKISSL
jgi:hypothetical protein